MHSKLLTECTPCPQPKRTPFSGLSRREKRRKMAAREDEEDRESGAYREVAASIRSAKKASRPERLQALRPERPSGFEAGNRKKDKKAKKSAFDREMGVAASAGEGKRPGKREREEQKGGAKHKLGRMGPKVKR